MLIRNFFIAALVVLFLIGCGGGSEGDGRAEATTANGFKAYDRMSVATYLPSLFTQLYFSIPKTRDQSQFTCNGGGYFNITSQPYSDDEYEPLEIMEYDFKDCNLYVNGHHISLDGKIFVFDLSSGSDIVGLSVLLDAFVKEGFKITIDSIIDATYGVSSFVAKESVMNLFEEGVKGSFFQIDMMQLNQKKVVSVTNLSRLKDANLGDILFYGMFSQFENFSNEGVNINGIYALPINSLDNFTDGLIDMEKSPEIQEILKITIDNGYFLTNLDDLDSMIMKSVLFGKDNKRVDMWQDKSEVVYAQVGDVKEYSRTTYTPDFSFVQSIIDSGILSK